MKLKMTSIVSHIQIFKIKEQTFRFTTKHSPIQSLSHSLSHHHLKSKRLHTQTHSTHPNSPSDPTTISNNTHFIQELLTLCVFTITLLSLRLASNILLPGFPNRWRRLVAFSEEAEAKCAHYPSHLWETIVASEDRRFFWHFGIDPVGIARAVLSLSALGGGSTITQQIYWGHGIYGIESASNFYFGKKPTLLSLGECAMLAGIIPSPELRSPLKDSSRGKRYQTRVLKRMVEVGFLDIEIAILVVKQPLHLSFYMAEYVDGLLPLASSSTNKGGGDLTVKEIWDWEKESTKWEAIEDMERWAVGKRARTVIFGSKNYVEFHCSRLVLPRSSKPENRE